MDGVRLRRRSEFTVRVWRSEVDRLWRFTVTAANGEKVAASEGYHNRSDCADMARRLGAGRWDVVDE